MNTSQKLLIASGFIGIAAHFVGWYSPRAALVMLAAAIILVAVSYFTYKPPRPGTEGE